VREIGEVNRGAVRQGPLGLRPDELRRVEFGGVAGEPFHLEARVGPEDASDPGARVDRGPIPEEDDRPSEVPEEGAQEGRDGPGGEVGRLKVDVEAQVLAAGRDGEGRQGGEAVPPLTVAEQGRLAAGGPGATDRRDEEEAALIEEGEMGPTSPRGFLYRASAPASTGRWRPRPAPGPGVRASGNSSPAR